MVDKHTTRGMTILQPETLESIYSRYLNRGRAQRTSWGLYLEEVRKRITTEDPALTEFINKNLSSVPKGLHNKVLKIAIGLYAVLETQTEINNMNGNR